MVKSAMGVVLALCGVAPVYAQGIAGGYPGDVGIQGHPDVILVEMFEESSVSNVAARWTSVEDGGNLSLDLDVPPGSLGTRSLRVAATAGTTGGYLYKRLSPGENDRVYLRYYVKYLSGTFHHSCGALGGYNPPSSWPLGGAGTVPTGSDRFSVRFEPVESRFGPVNNPSMRADFYAYWKDMQGIWGNYFLNDPSVTFARNTWTCVEFMVKLNNPVSAMNGELAVWIDGQSKGLFGNLQWRTVSALNLNWVKLENYATVDPMGTLQYDHVVVARSYIGPIGAGGGSGPPPPAPVPPPPSPSPLPPTGAGGDGGSGKDGACGCGSIAMQPFQGGITILLGVLVLLSLSFWKR